MVIDRWTEGCRRVLFGMALAVGLAGCATAPHVPLQVNVASVERIEGAPMELRFIAKLRVQNGNDSSMDFTGAFVELQLRGKTIGTGVSDARGSVPRFGEVVLDVPITVNALGEVREAIGLYGAPDRKLDVTLKGRLAGFGFEDRHFDWHGEMAMPLRPQ